MEFSTWDYYLTRPGGFSLRKINIDEDIDLKWGPLDLSSPKVNFEQSIFDRRPQSNYLRHHENIIQAKNFQGILSETPNLWVNGIPREKCTISFKYVDYKYLPFRCELSYKNGRLVAGEEYLMAINERIKTGDFIQDLKVSSDEKLMLMGGVNIRIQ